MQNDMPLNQRAKMYIAVFEHARESMLHGLVQNMSIIYVWELHGCSIELGKVCTYIKYLICLINS